MSEKRLYNLEDGTLITLYPKGMILQVKNLSDSVYKFSKREFAILYLLCISHPEIVRYEEFNIVLESINVSFKSVKSLQNEVAKLKKDLKAFGVYDLIIRVKGIGYCISKIWVEPIVGKPFRDYLRIKNIFRAILGPATNTNPINK